MIIRYGEEKFYGLTALFTRAGRGRAASYFRFHSERCRYCGKMGKLKIRT